MRAFPTSAAAPATLSLALALLFLHLTAGAADSRIDLSGAWRFQTDPTDIGISGKWYLHALSDSVRLPGSMAEYGQGDDIGVETEWTGEIVDRSWYTAEEYEPYRRPGNVKVPFWLNPVKHYVGAAWYQKDVSIPAGSQGRHIVLELERAHWESRLWVDGREAGMGNSLAAPHVFDLTDLLTPGEHTLTLRIDNRIREVDVGVNAHSISDHTQSNWNGVVGRIELLAGSPVYLDDIRVYPNVASKSVRVVIFIRNKSGRSLPGTVRLSAETKNTQPTVFLPPLTIDFSAAGERARLQATYDLGDKIFPWDESSPSLYVLRAELKDQAEKAFHDLKFVQFGMREFKPSGTRFAINGRPVFLRGTLECCIFPKTGYPAMDPVEWKRIFQVCKSHGLNHMRFHSWCPPEAAFAAADEMGIYLYVECGAWCSVGDGKPFDRWLYGESESIVRAFGNHPSFCLMSYGNEPGGTNQSQFLGDFVSYWKAKDPRRVYTSAAGWPLIAQNDFHVTPEPRIQHWGEGLDSVINKMPPQTLFDFREIIGRFDKPVVSHEIGQWCVYPNFREIEKYTGVLKARNFEIFRDWLSAAGMGGLADDFLMASGKLQALCYKADIEAALRTPGFAGFELLDLHDFPGQGTALVGVLDPFWEEKGYISPSEFRRFCAETVPLARLAKMAFTTDEVFSAAVEAAHFGPSPLREVVPEWGIADASGATVREGKFPPRNLPLGNGIPLGMIGVQLSRFAAPAPYRLTVKIGAFENSWDFWVYPAVLDEAGLDVVRVVRRLDEETVDFLESGGRAILTLERGAVRPDKGGDVAVGFSSIFWNTAWTRRQPPHTLGILCDPGHPALADFPTDFHSNWQWWDALSHCQEILLSDFDPRPTPIVRLIDDWFTNRPLGLVFEVAVGKGRIIVSGVDLLTDLDTRLEARQLLYSLKRYISGDKLEPAPEIEVGRLQSLFSGK